MQSPLETPPKVRGGGLPFTGLDISLLVVGAALLLIVGASLRRVARSKA